MPLLKLLFNQRRFTTLLAQTKPTVKIQTCKGVTRFIQEKNNISVTRQKFLKNGQNFFGQKKEYHQCWTVQEINLKANNTTLIQSF